MYLNKIENNEVIHYNEEVSKINKIYKEVLDTPEDTYNFEVEDYHTYYVTDNDVLVHNDCITDELSQIAEKWGDRKCAECADEMEVFLKSKGVKYQRVHIRYSGIGNRNYLYSDTFQMAIADNGYHTGILYAGKVYDNLFKKGIDYSKWITDFVELGTRSL